MERETDKLRDVNKNRESKYRLNFPKSGSNTALDSLFHVLPV